MKIPFKNVLGGILMLLLVSSCASSYNAIRPEAIQYGSKSESNGLVLQYKYNVLAESNNKKYAKKEMQNHMQLVAIKLTNNSDKVVNVPDDFRLFAGENRITPVAPALVHSSLKQGVPIYLLYLLLTPMQFNASTTNVNGQQQATSFPLGVILGPGITAFNMIKAGSANQSLLKDLQTYSLLNKQLQPGETTYALVGIANSGFSPIVIKAGIIDDQAKQ